MKPDIKTIFIYRMIIKQILQKHMFLTDPLFTKKQAFK